MQTHRNSTESSTHAGQPHSAARRLKPAIRILFLLCLMLLCNSTARAQFASGGVYYGSISVPGETNTWTFLATNGEQIVLRWAQLSATNGSGYMRVYAPDGTLLYTPGLAGGVREYAFTAATNGTFTVRVTYGPTGTGTYQFHFVKLPGAFIIPPGDDGGELSGSGGATNGVIGELGDLDLWTFSATNEERIVLRLACGSMLPMARCCTRPDSLAGCGNTLSRRRPTAPSRCWWLMVAAAAVARWGRARTSFTSSSFPVPSSFHRAMTAANCPAAVVRPTV
ncbi:MAG: hypothetical protein HY298_05805 [Verrucomicrobia bacterium]|nr:hypothetical protein [Verrucomicrobiota bacterium]